MSGHSKWSNIKNKKAATDSLKGKVFTQLSRNIRMAVREHQSGDPQFNAPLRLLLEKARSANMPKGKIQRAIDIGLGKGTAAMVQEIVYEGYGPGGVGILAVAQTENANRTAGEVRSTFSKHGGSLAGPNSVMFMYARNESGEYVCKLPITISDPQVQVDLDGLLEALTALDDIEEVFSAVVLLDDSE